MWFWPLLWGSIALWKLFSDYFRVFRAKAQRSASVPIRHHSSSSKIQTSYIPKSEKDFAKLLEFFVDYKHHQKNQQAHESKRFHNFSGTSRTKTSYLKDFLTALNRYEINESFFSRSLRVFLAQKKFKKMLLRSPSVIQQMEKISKNFWRLRSFSKKRKRL